MFSYITWSVDPAIFEIFGREIRWYGLLWACAIFAAWYIVKKLFKHENCPEEWVDKFFIYGVIGLIIGARLGHCLFYGVDGDFFYYYKNPLKILRIWEGGLSSHGGAFGLLIASFLYNKNVAKKGYIWVLDRLVIGVAIGGAFIRFGNLMNSEIFGGPTTLPWGFKFVRSLEWQRISFPCHPTQIYEIIYCLITFAVCMWLYWKKDAYQKRGLIFGVFLIGIFLSRFLLEFIKLNQGSFEQNLPLNMGQMLSIPFFVTGFVLLYRALKG